jgi:hypothetical protein
VTFIDKPALATFLGNEKLQRDCTERSRRGEKAAIVCSAEQPVQLHYGTESTMAKFRFTYLRRNAYGNVTTS